MQVKSCKLLQGEHSAILSIFIKQPFVIKIFVLSIFKRPFYTGYTIVPIAQQAGTQRHVFYVMLNLPHTHKTPYGFCEKQRGNTITQGVGNSQFILIRRLGPRIYCLPKKKYQEYRHTPKHI